MKLDYDYGSRADMLGAEAAQCVEWTCTLAYFHCIQSMPKMSY